MRLKRKEDYNLGKNNSFLDSSSLKVILLASAVIVFAVFLTGTISYIIARNSVVAKLKTRDLSYIAQSISDKIDGRIARAVETSLELANDPMIKKWIKDSEQDEVLGKFAKEKIQIIKNKFDYDNSFIVSTITNHYWAENGQLIDVVSKDDPDDSWFFDVISSNKELEIVIDYNKERNDTFAFIDAIMRDGTKPIAVVGVGLNLRDISNQFQSYKFGEKSNMWLIDGKGDIHIAEDVEQSTKNISEFLPKDISNRVISEGESKGSSVLEYNNSEGVTYDLVYQPLVSTDWKLVLQIPRDESVSILDAIKFNIVIACLTTMLIIVFLFYFVSNRIANPYKRAIKMAKEMERLVNERTRELREKNQNIMDSIEYAKMIQESILPSSKHMEKAFKEHFVLWKPKDIVGGDFYTAKKFDSGCILVVGDCTGHGVPGALMTMAVNSILDRIITEETIKNPGYIMSQLNCLLKETLYGRNSSTSINDGLDAGIVYIPNKGKAVFTGAGIRLYIRDRQGLQIIKNTTKGVGYRDISDDCSFESSQIEFGEDSIFYMTTDGYLHQNGGEKNFSFGRSRFEETISKYYLYRLPKQREFFEEELENYMGDESQRDDITVVAFKCFNN